MTPVYEVNTKHTRKVLEDFIDFTYKVKYPRVTFNLFVMAGCMATMAYMLRTNAGLYIMGGLALLLFVFALTRKQIGVSKLAKVDVNYQKQSSIHLIFGESEFRVENKDMEQDQKFRYGEVSFIYTDDAYYYLNINNEDLQLIPKADFVLGDSKEFYDFISDKTGCSILPTKVPWKMRIQMMSEYRDMKADERDKRQAQKKKDKKK